MQFIPAPPAPRKRGLRRGKKIDIVNGEFARLEKQHKKASVYYALGRCAGLTDEKLRAAVGPAISIIEGAG